MAKIDDKITMEKTFKLTYYDYGQPFYGSFRGMRYRIARDPLVNVYGKSAEVKADGKLIAIVWPGPYAYDFTPEDQKTSAEFPYSVEGKQAAIDWLNEQYQKGRDRYAKIYSIYR